MKATFEIEWADALGKDFITANEVVGGLRSVHPQKEFRAHQMGETLSGEKPIETSSTFAPSDKVAGGKRSTFTGKMIPPVAPEPETKPKIVAQSLRQKLPLTEQLDNTPDRSHLHNR